MFGVGTLILGQLSKERMIRMLRGNQKLKEKKQFSLIILILSLYFLISFAYASDDGIQVIGTAKVSVVPDMATFSFSINERGKILSNLKASVDDKSTSLVSFCKKLGIDSKHITSSEISIRPQYNYQTKSFIGYEVSRDIKVILNKLNKYSELVNGAINTGITTIRSVNLDIKDRVSLENKALGSAIEAAKIKAEIIVNNTGTKLGKVLSVKEGSLPFEAEHYKYRGLSESAPVAMKQGAFEPGEITITTNVVIMYEIN